MNLPTLPTPYPTNPNKQAHERRNEELDGSSLDVHSIFLTIQGEGPFAGRPAVFIRLAGCNLTCPGCDTDYTSTRDSMSPDEIAETVLELLPDAACDQPTNTPLVVITGGEPFRQKCGQLTEHLVDFVGMEAQFETNGTLYDDSMEPFLRLVNIVCSPKTGSVNKMLEPFIGSYKYILQEGQVDPTDGLPTSSLMMGVRPARPPKYYTGRIFVQPLDEKDPERNRLNTEAAIQSCLKFGYTLSIQGHKIVGLP